jgi:hypothetical protein
MSRELRLKNLSSLWVVVFMAFYSRGVAASSFLFCVGLAESEGFEEG